jgi:hypothetical protein
MIMSYVSVRFVHDVGLCSIAWSSGRNPTLGRIEGRPVLAWTSRSFSSDVPGRLYLLVIARKAGS